MSNMYSRNKQRKEQQLLNLRQLTQKTGNHLINTSDNDHNSSRSPPQSMASRSPTNLTNSSSPNQSSKTSLVSRSHCRTPKRETNTTNESQQQSSPSKSETNSMLRSVNRSPNVRSQTLRTDSRTVGLQSRPTLSPNSRRETSLPQSLSQSSPNSQNKQLSQIIKTNDNTLGVNQRSVKSIIEQTPQKSMSSTSTSTTTTLEPSISPEIVFLVKQQAMAIAKINALQKKVEQLEQSISVQKRSDSFNDNPLLEMTCASSSSANKSVNNTNNSKERIAISDDSGGEYSRATTTSDDDELSLLLDQIARRSQQLQSSHQINNRLTNNSINSSICGNNNNNNNTELLSQTMQSRSKRHTYLTPTTPMSHSNQSPIREQMIDKKVFNNYNNISSMITSQSSGVQPSAPQLPTMSSPYNQSISALIFEPNVENVLKNLDEIIAMETIDSNKFSNASTLSQTYQRSQTSQHSSQSLYENIGLNGVGVSSGSLLLQNNNNNSSSNWQLERAKTLVKQREEREFDKQMKLNEEWLQTQLKADPKPLRRNYIDSLDPSFR